jgi:4-hydroxy-tetrahydrodipicolinate reductase
MGIEVQQCIERSGDSVVSALVVRPGNSLAGVQPGLVDQLAYTDDIETSVRDVDVIIDFSQPEAFDALLVAARRHKTPLLSGTTGLSTEQVDAFHDLGQVIPVFYSPNMSIGVQVMLELVTQATKALGRSYDIELIETHHKKKRDAPSGTAKRLLRAIETVWEARPADKPEIAVHSIRGGDIVGDHTVHFMGAGDRIEITHRATARETFAAGALRAARWLIDQPPGQYTMRDMLKR